VNLVPNPSETWRRQHKFTCYHILPLAYHHYSHFLAATLGFKYFFTIAFFRATNFFYSWAVLNKVFLKIHHKPFRLTTSPLSIKPVMHQYITIHDISIQFDFVLIIFQCSLKNNDMQYINILLHLKQNVLESVKFHEMVVTKRSLNPWISRSTVFANLLYK